MKSPNQQIQDLLGDFNLTVKEITQAAADGLMTNGFKGMEAAIRQSLNELYVRGREGLSPIQRPKL